MHDKGLEDDEIRKVADTEVLDWFDNCPTLLIGDEIWLNGFGRLGTQRLYGGPGYIGPIPYDKIQEWTIEMGFDPDIMDASIAIIRGLDGRYMDWVGDESKKQSRKNK